MSEEDVSNVSTTEESTSITSESSASSEVGASLLTGESLSPEGSVSENEKKEENKQEDKDPLSFIPESPDKYNVTFEQDISVDNTLLESFKTTAHELGITQVQAQKLAEFYANQTASTSQKIQDAQVAEVMKAKNEWESEITSRPGFAKEVVDARRTLKEFGSSELNEIMDTSLLGSHPVFFDFIVNVGKALAEPESRGGSSGGKKEPSLMDRLWPNMK